MSKAKWTWLVYMAGDNNLNDAADNDIAEMRQVGSTPDVNVVFLCDRAGSGGMEVKRIGGDGVGEEGYHDQEGDTGDPETLYTFVAWTKSHYPAERYALIIWNHGSGWEPLEMDRIARTVNAVAYSGREMGVRSGSPLRRALFRTTLQEVYRLQTAEQRAIASDDGTGHSIDTVELGKVIKRICELLGQKLDLLGLDACLMSSLEVLYEIKDDVRYMVGSVENEPNDGWPYDVILRRLVDKPGVTTWALASGIVTDYMRSYSSYVGPVTQSAFDLEKIGDIEMPLLCLSNVLLRDMADLKYKIWKAQTRSANFWGRTLWDLGDWCRAFRRLKPERCVDHAARCVQESLDEVGFIIKSESQGRKVRNVAGLSIYLPPELTPVSPYYADLAFAKANLWDEVLAAYHEDEEPGARGFVDLYAEAHPEEERALPPGWQPA